MNILELYDISEIQTSKLGRFTSDELEQVKKNLEEIKLTNPAIDSLTIYQLMEALENFPGELAVLVSNKNLFEFYTKKTHPKDYFKYKIENVSVQYVRNFISRFLGKELLAAFQKEIENDNFNQILLLIKENVFFPNDDYNSIVKLANDKLDKALATVQLTIPDISELLFITDRKFYLFLSEIKNNEIERKRIELKKALENLKLRNPSSEPINKALFACSSYLETKYEIEQESIKTNTNSKVNHTHYVPKRKNHVWIYCIGFVLAFFKVIFIINVVNNALNENTTTNDEIVYEEEYVNQPKEIDRYYTNMKFEIDTFQTFLTDFEPNEIRRKTNLSIKNGQNPFEKMYQNPSKGETNSTIKIKNATKYDMVLLCNTIVYETIKLPNTAYFIKAGTATSIYYSSTDINIINIYMGEDLSTFQTNTLPKYVRNGSIVEYRFAKLAVNAKAILKTDYLFNDDVELKLVGTKLKVVSNNYKINPLSQD